KTPVGPSSSPAPPAPTPGEPGRQTSPPPPVRPRQTLPPVAHPPGEPPEPLFRSPYPFISAKTPGPATPQLPDLGLIVTPAIEGVRKLADAGRIQAASALCVVRDAPSPLLTMRHVIDGIRGDSSS